MSTALVDLAKAGLEKASQFSEKFLAPYVTESAERTLRKMGPQGETTFGMIKNFESDWKKWAQNTHTVTGLPMEIANSQAKDAAKYHHFGPKNQILTNQLKAIEAQYQSPATGAIKKRTAADILSTYLKEPGSQQWRKAAGVPATSPYSGRTELEKSWSNFASWIYLSKIAIPHTMQPLNLLLEGRSTSAFGKALWETATDFKSALKQTELSGAMVDEMLHATRPGTSVANAIEKVFHMPGFKQMRRWQLAFSAIDGKYSAIESAEKYINSGFTSNAEEIYLRHLGIDPRDIKSRGLSQSDIDKAMYRVAHNAMYIRTGLETPSVWNRSGATRLMTQYKGYSFNQARIITDAYRRQYAMHGLAGIAKVSAVVGALFPIAGQFIWSVDSLVNSGDPSKREDVLKNFDDGGPIDNYISSLAHMAGLGIGYSVMRAANRNALESYMLGPLGNLISDEFSGLQHGFKSGNFDQWFRTNFHKVPIVGGYLARQIVPTAKQQSE